MKLHFTVPRSTKALAAVQLGTPFAVTEGWDADIAFKRMLAEARDEDMVEFSSVAGLRARAVLTTWLRDDLAAEPGCRASRT